MDLWASAISMALNPTPTSTFTSVNQEVGLDLAFSTSALLTLQVGEPVAVETDLWDVEQHPWLLPTKMPVA